MEPILATRGAGGYHDIRDSDVGGELQAALAEWR